MEAGPLIFPLVLAGMGDRVLLTSVEQPLRLFVSKGNRQSDRRRQSIDSILFWGGYRCRARLSGPVDWYWQVWRGYVAERGIVNPQVVVYGLSESLLTTVSGMVLLVVAAFSVVLPTRVGLWRLEKGGV